jgi:heme exporter protein CcmD
MTTLLHFLHMGGYAFYVWSAYGCTLAILFLQWLRPWLRWRKYLRAHHEQTP